MEPSSKKRKWENQMEPNSKKRKLDESDMPKHLAKMSKLCPRCGSSSVRFVMYANNNTEQPRYHCRACKKGYTLGGKVNGGKQRSEDVQSTSKVIVDDQELHTSHTSKSKQQEKGYSHDYKVKGGKQGSQLVLSASKAIANDQELHISHASKSKQQEKGYTHGGKVKGGKQGSEDVQHASKAIANDQELHTSHASKSKQQERGYTHGGIVKGGKQGSEDVQHASTVISVYRKLHTSRASESKQMYTKEFHFRPWREFCFSVRFVKECDKEYQTKEESLQSHYVHVDSLKGEITVPNAMVLDKRYQELLEFNASESKGLEAHEECDYKIVELAGERYTLTYFLRTLAKDIIERSTINEDEDSSINELGDLNTCKIEVEEGSRWAFTFFICNIMLYYEILVLVGTLPTSQSDQEEWLTAGLLDEEQSTSESYDTGKSSSGDTDLDSEDTASRTASSTDATDTNDSDIDYYSECLDDDF